MNNIVKYITEKLKIDSNVESKTITEQLTDIIKEYCQNVLKLDTQDYVSHCEDDKGNSVFARPEKCARIYLWSKNFRYIDKVAEDLKPLLNKIKKVKKYEVYATAIYFYFEEYESTE